MAALPCSGMIEDIYVLADAFVYITSTVDAGYNNHRINYNLREQYANRLVPILL